MNRLLGTLAGIALFASLATPMAARAEDKDTIEYRQRIMKTLGEQTGSLGLMAQKKIPDANFAAHLQILAETAALAKAAFTPKVAGGTVKGTAVWDNWADFSKKMDELVQVADAGAKAAKAQGAAAGMPRLTCRGCHDMYREEKK